MRKTFLRVLTLVMILSMLIPAPVVSAAPAAQTPPGFWIGGHVRGPDGAPVAGVQLAYAIYGEPQGVLITDSTGVYGAYMEEFATVLITPTADGYSMMPTNHSVDFVMGPIYDLDFTATGTRSINGVLSSADAFCIASATLRFHRADDVVAYTATSDSAGLFNAPSLEPIVYTMKYERSGCVTWEGPVDLTTSSKTLNISVAAQNYTASGKIQYPNGRGIPGAQVTYTLNGGANLAATSGADGAYSIPGITLVDTVVITPALPGYQFTPAQRTVSSLSSDATGLNFTSVGTRVAQGQIVPVVPGPVNPNCIANAPLVFTPVQPLEGEVKTITSDVMGQFSIDTLEPIAYQLTISRLGCSYTGIPYTLPANGTDLTNLSFTAQDTRFTISGRASTGFPPQAVGATVQFTGTAADGAALDFSTTTDADGNYELANQFKLNDQVTIHFSADAYNFSPASIPLAPLQSDMPGQNSIATRKTYTVAGIVRLQDLTTPLEGATLSFNGQTATSGSDGRYQFLNVPHGVTSSLTAAFPGLAFLPKQISNLNANIDETGPNGQFAALPNANISGKVTYKGAALAGVTVTFNLLTTTTAADGTYQFAAIPPGTTGEITPSLAGYIFTPEKIAAVMPAIDALGTVALPGQDFTALKSLSLSGKVVAKDGVTPLPGVTFQYGAASAVSGADGTYTITGIPEGASANLTPSLSGYRFIPEKTALKLTKNTRLSTVTKAIRVFVVSGQVTGAPDAIFGVKISLGRQTTLTEPDGSFSLTTVDEDTSGSLIASKPGYHFDPEKIRITHLSADMPANIFASAPNVYTLSGTVRYKDRPLSGAMVTLTSPGAANSTVVTGKNGRYAFDNIVYGTQYTLITDAPGYNFSPWIYSVPVKAADQKRNITATAYQRLIFGFIGGLMVPGEQIRVYYGKGSNDYVTTNFDGSFTLPRMAANKTITVRPSSKKYAFLPPTFDFPPGNNFVLATGFNAYPSTVLSGKITVAGKPVHGARVSFMDLYKTTTDTQGKYHLQVPMLPGQALLVQHPYFNFIPQVVDFSGNTSFNWNTATVSVSGRLLDSNGLGASGTVRVSATQFAPALLDGSFSLEVGPVDKVNLWNFALRPEVALGYHTHPATIMVSPRQGASNKTFTLAPNEWSVSGKVTYNGKALAGVTVTDTHSGRKAVTDASGAYLITKLKFNAPVLLRATRTGFTFSEPAEFIMGNARLSGQNFTAAR